MVITVVIRVPAVPLSFLLAIAETGLVGVTEAHWDPARWRLWSWER